MGETNCRVDVVCVIGVEDGRYLAPECEADGLQLQLASRLLCGIFLSPAFQSATFLRVGLEIVELDRGCFACMIGGVDNKTLFLIATGDVWRKSLKLREGELDRC
jgi:hypothetical protein